MLYSLMSTKFRRAFHRILSCRLGRGRGAYYDPRETTCATPSVAHHAATRQGELEGGRNCFARKGYGTFIYAWNRFLQTIQPTQARQGSCGVVIVSLPFSTVTYWIMHAQYFALINLNLRLWFCARASFCLLLILLKTRVKRLSDDAGSGERDLIVNKTFSEKNGRLAIPENNKVGNSIFVENSALSFLTQSDRL